MIVAGDARRAYPMSSLSAAALSLLLNLRLGPPLLSTANDTRQDCSRHRTERGKSLGYRSVKSPSELRTRYRETEPTGVCALCMSTVFRRFLLDFDLIDHGRVYSIVDQVQLYRFV